MASLSLPSVPSDVFTSDSTTSASLAATRPASLRDHHNQQQQQPDLTATHSRSSPMSNRAQPPSLFIPKKSTSTRRSSSAATTSAPSGSLRSTGTDDLAQELHALEVELGQLDPGHEERQDQLVSRASLLVTELNARFKQQRSQTTASRDAAHSGRRGTVLLSAEEVASIDQRQSDWEAAHPLDAATPPASRAPSRSSKSRKRGGAPTSAYTLARPSWWNDAMGQSDADLEDEAQKEAGVTAGWGSAVPITAGGGSIIPMTAEDGSVMLTSTMDATGWFEDDDTLLRQLEDAR